MTLHIQDPNSPEGDYLIDALLDACRLARAGGGAFAFLSAGGVQLLLRDETFAEFLRQGTFDLVVGVDAITDIAAIAALTQVQQQRPTLGARVFIPSHPRSIFHPKFAWFDHGSGGVLITGSGNLTAGGLRWNIEAFSVVRLDEQSMAALRTQWDAYAASTAACQRLPGDQEVLARLERNAARRRAMRELDLPESEELAQAEAPSLEPGGKESTPVAESLASVQPVAVLQDTQPADAVPPFTDDTEVLIAQIPRASTRWGQANFDQEHFFGFFGASQTIRRRAYFFHVRNDGSLGHQEVRPAVAVASQNYRFELDAAAGLPYPANGRPLGVFAKVGARTFAYMLLMPGTSGHAELMSLLERTVRLPAGRMKRRVFLAREVQAEWPASPLWGGLTLAVGI